MQQPSKAAGTWRIGFDLAAFVLLAAVSGMAAAVTLASIALLLSSVVSGTPAAASGAPALHFVPAEPGAPGGVSTVPAAPAAVPAAPAPDPDAREAPGDSPVVQTQLAHAAAPGH